MVIINGNPNVKEFKKETLEQVFFCEFCEISKNTFSYRTPPMAASLFLNMREFKIEIIPISKGLIHIWTHFIPQVFSYTPWKHSLRKKCPYADLFWSVFSRIWTQYGDIRKISKCGKIRTNVTTNKDTFHTVIRKPLLLWGFQEV